MTAVAMAVGTGRGAEQEGQADAGQGDVTHAVAEQGEPTLHEEDADERRDEADERRGEQRASHEVEVEDGSWLEPDDVRVVLADDLVVVDVVVEESPGTGGGPSNTTDLALVGAEHDGSGDQVRRCRSARG